MVPLTGKRAKKKICSKNKLFRSEITLSTPEHKQHAPWKSGNLENKTKLTLNDLNV